MLFAKGIYKFRIKLFRFFNKKKDKISVKRQLNY